MLRVEQVSFSFGQKQALREVSLEAQSARFTALLGPNGAGTSTLFNLLTRLYATVSGRIELAGVDLNTAPRAALAQLGVVFQQPTLDLDLTVRQNLAYFAALHGLSGQTASRRIDEALERLDMRARAGEKTRALNGGHRRRTEIARALIHAPKVLLCDEATVGLDAAARTAITAHVHDLADDGMTVLWATHLTDEVRPDDDLVLLHQGAVKTSGRARDLHGATPLRDWFLAQTGAPA